MHNEADMIKWIAVEEERMVEDIRELDDDVTSQTKEAVYQEETEATKQSTTVEKQVFILFFCFLLA